MRDNAKRPRERMVHARLTEELHKRLRIRAAENDTTLQGWVATAIKNELDRNDQGKKTTSWYRGIINRQVENLRSL